MLKSMTGFGRAEGNTALGRVAVESRSVNHRYLDINLRLPRRLMPFENRIKEIIKAEVSRGRVDVSVKLDSSGESKVQLSVDFSLAEQYYGALQTLKEALRLPDEITLGLLSGAKDLITGKEETEDVEPYWQEIEPIVRESLRALDGMKRSEGESIVRDIQGRLKRIAEEMKEIRRSFPGTVRATRDRLHDRIQALLGTDEMEPARFQQEIAFLAERTDITEEIVRAESHLAQFSGLLKRKDPVGRTLDFLTQEIHREVNTASAKANDAGISQRVVEIKSELEKVREQVQNIE